MHETDTTSRLRRYNNLKNTQSIAHGGNRSTTQGGTHRLTSQNQIQFPCNKFSYMMKKTVSPNCEECGLIEDLQHLLMVCLGYGLRMV